MKTCLISRRVSLLVGSMAWCLASFGLETGGIQNPLLSQEPANQATGHTTDLPLLNSDEMLVELERLERICISLGLEVEAQQSSRWLPARQSLQRRLYLPMEPWPIAGDDLNRASWAQHFNSARAAYARGLYQQASELAGQGDESQAFELLWQVLREDSSHAQAKRVLGTLATAAEVQPRLRKGTSVHPDFGWPAGSYWQIETPHFSLTTRAETEPSLEMAQLMERFYGLWRQVFYPLWARPGVLLKRMQGGNSPWDKSRKYQVILLRDRQDYLAVLGVAEKNAAVSVGYYEPRLQKSFFFVDAGWQETLFHELTHQLLNEATSIQAEPDAGTTGGIWLMEGIALYMESLIDRGSYWTLGGFAAPRLQTARYRAVRDGWWAAWPEFTSAGREQWKQDQQISLLYTQATGLSHVAMDQLQQPAARQALFQALVSVYQNQPEFAELLAQLAPTASEAQLNYQQALTLGDAQVAQIVLAGEPCAALVLAGSELQATTWSQLQTLADDLQWLDVSFSNACSQDLLWLDQAKNLQRLSLEGTHCDGALLERVRQLPQLTELDLTGCAIDNEGLEALRGHPLLTTLWLEGTQITSAARETLDSLPKLEICHSTAIAWQRPSP